MISDHSRCISSYVWWLCGGLSLKNTWKVDGVNIFPVLFFQSALSKTWFTREVSLPFQLWYIHGISQIMGCLLGEEHQKHSFQKQQENTSGFHPRKGGVSERAIWSHWGYLKSFHRKRFRGLDQQILGRWCLTSWSSKHKSQKLHENPRKSLLQR